MVGLIGTVQVSHRGPDDDEGTDYWQNGSGARLLSMYGDLLGMQHIYIGYHKLVHQDGRTPEIGFEYSPDDEPPQWPDLDHPQQVHLDIEVRDLDEAEKLVVSRGATALDSDDDRRVFADPMGHPFCIYATTGAPRVADDVPPGRIARIVFDCFSPRALASFYGEFLDMRTWVLDTPERVEIAGGPNDVVLAFQHSLCQPPRWPDSKHPPQLHLDITFEEQSARDLAERLGAIDRSLPQRPDNLVYADPAGHPFCLGIVGLGGWGTYGPTQVAEYEAWLAEPEGGDGGT